MGKRETAETYKDTKASKVATDTKYGAAEASSADRSANMAPGLGELGNQVQTGWMNPQQVTAERIKSGGDVSNNNLNDVFGQYKDFAGAAGGFNAARGSVMDNVNVMKGIGASETGGLTAENIARMRGAGGFDALANNGGLDATAMDRMRGMGGYDEFAKTGGYSPQNIANIKAQAISPIGSYATGTRDELARRAASQGGYAPGFDAANRALQRDTARGMADTSLNANIGIQDRINQGRLAGIAGVAGTEAGLQGMRTGNMMGAAQGISGAESDIARQTIGNRLAASQGAGNMEISLQDRIANYTLAGMSGEQATAQAIADNERFNITNRQNVDMFNAGNNMNAQQFNAGQYNTGMGGLQSLYNTNVGREQAELDRSAGLLGQGTQGNLGYLSGQGDLAKQPGMGGNIMKGIGTAAGIGAAIYTGGLSTVAQKALASKKAA